MTERRNELTRLLADVADEATRCLGRFEATVSIAGFAIRLVFAGRRLRDQMMLAFQHLESQAEAAGLEIRIWDQVQSGVSLPRQLWPLLSPDSQAMLRSKGELTLTTTIDEAGFALDAWDEGQSLGFCLLHDAHDPKEWDTATPLRNVINWALHSRGLTGVHAGAVGTERGGLLLSGISGVGKSTTSLACVEQGFDFVADDFCLLGLEESVTAYSVFCTGKAYEHQLKRLPRFNSIVANRARLPDEKALGYLPVDPSNRVRTELPVRAAVLLASKGNDQASLQRIAGSKALLGFGPSTLLTFRGMRQKHLSSLKELVSRVACFEMHLSSDVEENPRALRRLLEELDGEVGSK